MEALIKAYCTPAVSEAHAGFRDHTGEHEWENLGTVRRPTLNRAGEEKLRCMTCGVTTYRIVYGESTIVTGKCGTEVYWRFDPQTGTLIISGNGDMWDMYGGWYDEELGGYGYPYVGRVSEGRPANVMACDPVINSDDVKTVIVEEGVKRIGSSAFDSFLNLERAVFPASAASFGENGYPVFDMNPSLQMIVFQGDATNIVLNALTYEKCFLFYPADNCSWIDRLEEFQSDNRVKGLYAYDADMDIMALNCAE